MDRAFNNHEEGMIRSIMRSEKYRAEVNRIIAESMDIGGADEAANANALTCLVAEADHRLALEQSRRADGRSLPRREQRQPRESAMSLAH